MQKKLHPIKLVFNFLFFILVFTIITTIIQAQQRFGSEKPREALALIAPFLPKNPVILEAGAFNGEDTAFMAQFLPDAQIHAFEPLPQTYKRLLTSINGLTNVQTYELALSDKIGLADFYVSNISWEPHWLGASSSLMAPKEHLTHAPFVDFSLKTTVQTTTIDSWAQEHNINHVDFMWLDMQGYELAALKAAPTIIKTVKAILTEVEFVEAYTGQPLYNEIKDWLNQQGFELIATSFDPSSPGWCGDALFVRK